MKDWKIEKENGKIEMKKIIITAIALIFVFFAAGFSFAANELQIKGTVTKINGSQITIKDDKGKETTVESNTSGLKVSDKVLVTVIVRLQNPKEKLTAEDIEFLTKQCLIDRADIDVIPQLREPMGQEETREILFSKIDKRDCKLMVDFKVSRDYYRQLKPRSRIPLPPAGWHTVYLTDKEFENYTDILANAPW